MATQVSRIEELARLRLIEVTPRFWSSAELTEIIASGIRDLWRATVDLKQEHYLTIDPDHVTLEADATELTGVPLDVHKIYLIEAVNSGENDTNNGLIFEPLDYNHKKFKSARARGGIDPRNDVIYYSITSQGAPVNAPIIRIAPTVNSAVSIRFCYVPTLGTITTDSVVPIPGEADNALVSWTVAWARAKEREDRSPDPNWLSIYATEKNNLLASLGLRQYQELQYVDAMWEEYWG